MAMTTKKVAIAKKAARPRAMPLPPPSTLPDVLPPLPLSTLDLLEVGPDPEASWPPAEDLVSETLAKATSRRAKKSSKVVRPGNSFAPSPSATPSLAA
jgi:hypothetical protein